MNPQNTPSRRQIIVYVAGPFRAPTPWQVEQNVRRAEESAAECWANGFTAICPHANSRFMVGVAPETAFLEGDLEILRRCDCLLVDRDWTKSKGTCKEVGLAMQLGKPVFGSISELCEAYPV